MPSKHGDDRRTRIVERAAAQALDETALMPAEPVTIVLSERGWVRAAKGHDIDPLALSYRSATASWRRRKAAATRPRCSSTAPAGSTACRRMGCPRRAARASRCRAGSILPTARPLPGTLIGAGEDRWLLATSDGYGFVAKLAELASRNRSGKHVLKVSGAARVLRPCAVPADDDALVAAVSNEGKLLCFPLGELPELARGRGNKLLGIDSKKFAAGEEQMVAAVVLPAGRSLRVMCGQRTMTLKARDLEDYLGERARRGSMLPRGWRKVDDLAVEA
jgi:topoisomerase IV subunit A